MIPELMRFVRRLQSLVSDLLVLGGVALVGCGIVYFVSGWRFGVYVLLFTSAFGCLLFASGVSLRHPASITTLRTSTAAFALSSVLLAGVWLLSPGQPVLVGILGASCLGCAGSYARLRGMRA